MVTRNSRHAHEKFDQLYWFKMLSQQKFIYFNQPHSRQTMVTYWLESIHPKLLIKDLLILLISEYLGTLLFVVGFNGLQRIKLDGQTIRKERL